jgi:ankyrin repeat protein
MAAKLDMPGMVQKLSGAGAARHNNVASAKDWLSQGANPNATDLNGDPPLYRAARWGHTEVTRVLIEANADVNDQPSSLNRAARWGHTETTRVLMDANADVNTPNENGDTPLHRATRWGHTETVLALLDGGARHDLRNENTDTPLLLAARKGHADVVTALLAGGADPLVVRVGEEDSTAITVAQQAGHDAVAAIIIESVEHAPPGV